MRLLVVRDVAVFQGKSALYVVVQVYPSRPRVRWKAIAGSGRSRGGGERVSRERRRMMNDLLGIIIPHHPPVV